MAPKNLFVVCFADVVFIEMLAFGRANIYIYIYIYAFVYIYIRGVRVILSQSTWSISNATELISAFESFGTLTKTFQRI